MGTSTEASSDVARASALKAIDLTGFNFISQSNPNQYSRVAVNELSDGDFQVNFLVRRSGDERI